MEDFGTATVFAYQVYWIELDGALMFPDEAKRSHVFRNADQAQEAF